MYEALILLAGYVWRYEAKTPTLCLFHSALSQNSNYLFILFWVNEQGMKRFLFYNSLEIIWEGKENMTREYDMLMLQRPHEKIGVVDAQSIERKVLPSYEISYNVLTSFTRMDLWFLFLAWMLPDDAKSYWGFLAVKILPIGYRTLLFSSSFLMSSTAVTTRARFRSCSVPEHTTDSFAVISCWRRNVFWLLFQ